MNKIKKRLISIITSLLMVFTSSIVCFADNNINTSVDVKSMALVNTETEVLKAINGISDVPITDELLESIQAEYSNGDKIEPMDIKATITKIPVLNNEDKVKAVIGNDNNASEIYAMTVYASQKHPTVTGDCSNKNINASGTLTMYWTDNLFPKANILNAVAGNWNVGSGVKVTNRQVSYFIDTDYTATGSFYPTSDSFSYNINKSGQKLICKSWLYVSKGSEKGTVSIRVSPIT